MISYLRPKPHRLRVDVNMAPYASLILILISLIAMMMVPLFRQPIPLHDLAAVKTNTTTIAPIIITIDQRGYSLNTEGQPEEVMSLDAMKNSLNKQFKIMDPKQTSICIKADSAIPYGTMLGIIDWLQDLGTQHIGLLTTPSVSPPKSA